MILPMINDYNDPNVNKALLKCAEALSLFTSETPYEFDGEFDQANGAFPTSECNSKPTNSNSLLTY